MLPDKLVITVAPWALPKEPIPVGIVIHSQHRVDFVELEYPRTLEIVEEINIAQSDRSANGIRVRGLISGPFDGVWFCGIVLRYSGIPDEPVTLVSVHARTEVGDGTELSASAETRVGRPFLELLTAPTKVTVKGEEESNLPLALKYRGFGDILVSIQAKIAGQIVSHGEGLIYELAKRLVQTGPPSPEADQAGGTPPIEVDPGFVRQVVEQVEELIVSEKPALAAMLDAAALAEFRDWLKDAGAREGVVDMLLMARINQLLVGILQELLGRSPVNGVTLKDARTSIDTVVSAPVTELRLEIHYKDRAGNDYDPVRVNLQVEELSSERGERRVRIPVTVSRWVHEPVLNISGLSSVRGEA